MLIVRIVTFKSLLPNCEFAWKASYLSSAECVFVETVAEEALANRSTSDGRVWFSVSISAAAVYSGFFFDSRHLSSISLCY